METDDEAPGPHISAILSLLSLPILLHDDDHWLLSLFQKIEKEFKNRNSGYMSHTKALLTSLILTILGKLFPSGSLFFEDECSIYSIQREELIEQYFIKNYYKNITVTTLSKELYLSPRQVNRIINVLYGCSFNRKLLELRLEYAKLMLLHTENKIYEIAAQCGFNSTNYFHAVFNKTIGCSPLKYRQNGRRSVVALSSELFEKK
jgi:AraC-like DNA-binding protein